MSNKPLAYRLGIYISVAVTIVYAAFILWAYNYNYILLKQEVENEALITSGKISNLVSEMVISTQQVAGNIAWQVNFYKSEGKTGNFLGMLMQRFPHIKVIQLQLNDLSEMNGNRFYVASYKDSSFVFSDDNSRRYACFDLATQSSLLPDSNHPGWSEPYKSDSFEGVLSAYYLPFQFYDQFENEEVSGYIICETSLQYFQEMIEKTKIGERGFAFLTSAKGTYMTHPIKEMVMNRTIHNLPDKVFPYDSAFRSRFIKGLTGSATVYPTPLNYEKAWSYPIKILENDWLLAFTLPTAELYQELRYLLLKMIGISLVVIAMVFFIVFTISSRIMQPLSQISSELHNFSSDQPSTIQGGINELQTLQESLIRLQKMYDSFKKREHESNLGKARINAELAAASEVQQSIIPRIGTHNFIDFGITVHSVFEPANIVSGDLYDFFPIDEKRLLITIGDVSGGGVPAALFMGVAHTLIKSNAPIGSAKDIVYLANKELCKNNSNQFFLSLFLGIIDTEHRTLNFCNAGHTPTFVLSESGHVRELGNPHGLPLGLYAERTYKDSKIHLDHGDTIIMYTDGISEQLDNNGKFFGVEGLVKLFDIIRGQHPENMAGIIIKSVTDFAGDTPFVDDLTLLIVKLDEA